MTRAAGAVIIGGGVTGRGFTLAPFRLGRCASREGTGTLVSSSLS